MAAGLSHVTKNMASRFALVVHQSRLHSMFLYPNNALYPRFVISSALKKICQLI